MLLSGWGRSGEAGRRSGGGGGGCCFVPRVGKGWLRGCVGRQGSVARARSGPGKRPHVASCRGPSAGRSRSTTARGRRRPHRVLVWSVRDRRPFVSAPLPSGRHMPSTTTSGRTAGPIARAAATDAASPTTVIPAWPWNRPVTPRRTISCSSTTGPRAPAGSECSATRPSPARKQDPIVPFLAAFITKPHHAITESDGPAAAAGPPRGAAGGETSTRPPEPPLYAARVPDLPTHRRDPAARLPGAG